MGPLNELLACGSTYYEDQTMPDLQAQLVEAFPPTPLEPATFSESATWDSYVRREAFEADIQGGRSWDMLGSEFVQFHMSALGHMNPDAFASVIPAYLAALVRGDTENELPAFVFSQLTRREDWIRRFDARVARLTEQQCIVIARVLEALAKGDRFPQYKAKISAAIDSWRGILDAHGWR
jgi:hypothetical protein